MNSVEYFAPGGVALVLGALLVAFVAGHSRTNRILNSIVLRHAGDPPSLQEIEAQLMALNGARFVFSAEWRSNLEFRGRRITLAYGDVGHVGVSKGGPTWIRNRTLYAVVKPEQVSWMTANPDVFKPAFLGTDVSIFFATIGKFES